ncbi:MAG: DUF3240 family protein [Gallionella sp.]|jgi:hypothetical protein|nr:DUF3240 family protein [Gallionella sp.]
MKDMNCCLTLVCHKSLEERIVDHLLEHPEWVRGFTLTETEGASQKEHLPTVLEQVRGRSHRRKFLCVMNLEDAHALISHLREEEHNREVAYWITPVLEFGRLE